MNVKSALDALAAARAAADAADAAYAEAYALFVAEFGHLDTARKTAAQAAAVAYDNAAEIILATFSENGSIDDPDAQVKMVETVEYAPESALAWAVKAGRTDLLKLDDSAFKKAAKAGGVDGRRVKVAKQPKVYIGAKLGHRLQRA